MALERKPVGKDQKPEYPTADEHEAHRRDSADAPEGTQDKPPGEALLENIGAGAHPMSSAAGGQGHANMKEEASPHSVPPGGGPPPPSPPPQPRVPDGPAKPRSAVPGGIRPPRPNPSPSLPEPHARPRADIPGGIRPPRKDVEGCTPGKPVPAEPEKKRASGCLALISGFCLLIPSLWLLISSF
jgi:hypothetical protein